MKPLRGAAVSSVATLALLGLSACGDNGSTASKGSDASSSSSQSPTSSGSSTPTSGSSDASQRQLLADPPSAGSDVSADDFGALFKNAFAKASTAHITLMSSGSTGVSAEGDADYGSPAKVDLTMTIPQLGEAEVLLVDNVVYVKTKQLGDKYLKLDLSDPSNPLGPLLSNGLDPSSMVNSLTGAITKATYVGQEDVKGDQLDHYKVQVDSAKLLAGATSALPSGAPSPSAGVNGLPKQLTYEMYFDKDGYFRQFSADLGSTAGSFTAAFSDWGKSVSISAPPSSQVTELPGSGTMSGSPAV